MAKTDHVCLLIDVFGEIVENAANTHLFIILKLQGSANRLKTPGTPFEMLAGEAGSLT